MAKRKTWADIADELRERADGGATIDQLFDCAVARLRRPITREGLERAMRRYDISTNPTAVVAKLDTDQKQRAARKAVRGMAAELKIAQDKLDLLLDVKNTALSIPHIARDTAKRQAVAVAMASDWHIEERVDAVTVNGRNKYDPDIARKRAHRFFQGLEWLVTHHRHSFDIEKLVLWIGGDIITGYIHEELVESNHMSPTKAVLFALELFTGGIRFLQDLDIDVHVVCSYGNHGRTTPKRRISTGAHNSFEWLLYKVLAQNFEEEERVTFTIADGDHVYVDIYGYTFRFTHGDNFKYGGGVGGISIPVLRGTARLESFKHADYTCLGHFHQYRDFGSVVVNGSLVGYSPYAVKINAEYEPPQQAFFLVDPKEGKCQMTPIWVHEKKGKK